MSNGNGKKNVGGRPSKLTDEMLDTIVKHLKTGNFVSTACRLSGITERSYYGWMETGEADFVSGKDTMHARFFQSTTHAIADAEDMAVYALRRAWKEDWRAAAWYLERRKAGKWARRDRMEVTGKDGGPIEHDHRIDLSRLTHEELEQLDSIVRKASESPGD